MNAPKRALLLVGSPKGAGSTSHSLGTYLVERLQTEGFEAQTLYLKSSTVSKAGREELLHAIDSADVIALTFPLYVDALPSWVIGAMELVARRRQETSAANEPLLLAISNCGFPEARHNEPALSICRHFAREAGFKWAGGLALGGGGAIDGRPLEKLGGMTRNIRKSLDLAAAALAQGQPATQEAANLMAKPLMPTWIYVMMGNLGWGSQAKKNGVRSQIHERPYSI